MQRLQPMKMALEGGGKVFEHKRLVLCKNIGYPFYAVEREAKKEVAAGNDEGDDGEYVDDEAEEVAEESQIRTRAAGEREGKLLESEIERREKKIRVWDEV
jgi:hypothetical protein